MGRRDPPKRLEGVLGAVFRHESENAVDQDDDEDRDAVEVLLHSEADDGGPGEQIDHRTAKLAGQHLPPGDALLPFERIRTVRFEKFRRASGRQARCGLDAKMRQDLFGAPRVRMHHTGFPLPGIR